MHHCSSECGSISIMQLLILQTLLRSEIMRRTDLTASLNFKLQSTFDQFEVEHTNARCHLKSDFGVHSSHVFNISWAFYFNQRFINTKSDEKHSLLFEVGLRGLYSWHVCKISWAFNFIWHLIKVKLETQTLVAIWCRTLGSIADTFVTNSWAFNFNRHNIWKIFCVSDDDKCHDENMS